MSDKSISDKTTKSFANFLFDIQIVLNNHGYLKLLLTCVAALVFSFGIGAWFESHFGDAAWSRERRELKSNLTARDQQISDAAAQLAKIQTDFTTVRAEAKNATNAYIEIRQANKSIIEENTALKSEVAKFNEKLENAKRDVKACPPNEQLNERVGRANAGLAQMIRERDSELSICTRELTTTKDALRVATTPTFIGGKQYTLMGKPIHIQVGESHSFLAGQASIGLESVFRTEGCISIEANTKCVTMRLNSIVDLPPPNTNYSIKITKIYQSGYSNPELNYIEFQLLSKILSN